MPIWLNPQMSFCQQHEHRNKESENSRAVTSYWDLAAARDPQHRLPRILRNVPLPSPPFDRPPERTSSTIFQQPPHCAVGRYVDRLQLLAWDEMPAPLGALQVAAKPKGPYWSEPALGSV